jgi:hypothetical protein
MAFKWYSAFYEFSFIAGKDLLLRRRHDTQHKDIQHNDTQHKDIQHNDTRHKDIQHNDTKHKDIQHNDTQQRHSA